MDPQEKIFKAFQLAGKALRPGEIAELTGMDEKEVQKCIKKMKSEGSIHSPRRCYYDTTKK